MPNELLRVLAAQGVELWFEGERLRFRAPKGALTPELRAELGARRAEVLDNLRADAEAAETTYPLSFSQRSLWFLHQEDPKSPSYNVGFAARVVSPIDVAALRQAMQALVDRHATLRTAYPAQDGLPVQLVAGYATAALDIYDVARLDERALRIQVEADYKRPFDLACGPVFRAALYTRATSEHVLLLNVHHIAADGWSLLQLLEELRALYAEATGGPPCAAVRPEATYIDFTRWQAEMLAGPAGQRLAEYWQRQLAAPRAEIELPADRRRSPRRTSQGATLSFELEVELSQGLRKLARDESTTLFVVLLAAFKTLLYRYTGTHDVIVGTPTFGRNRPELARVIGDFVNTVALRSRLDAALPFRELLAQLRQTVLEALDAQDYPFPLVVEQLQPARDPSRSPLFETLFVLQRFDQLRELEPVLVASEGAASIDFGGLKLAHYALDQQEGQFDLTMQSIDRSGALAVQLKYNVELFDESTVARLAGHLRTLLHAVIEDPAQPLGQLRLLPRAERRELVAAAGRVTAVSGLGWTLHERFEQQVCASPDAIALTCEDLHLSYGELNRRANRLAHRLRALGVGSDTLVGLCCERSLDLVVGLIGILKAGGAYLPVDLSYPSDRVTFMLDDARAPVLVTQRALAGRFPEHRGITVFVDDALAEQPESDPPHLGSPDDLAYAIYTSGSTGRPKGTMLTHRAVQRLFTATDAWYGFGAADVWTMFHSVAFDFSVWELWGALLYGGRLVVVPYWVSRAPDAFWQLLQDQGVTVLNQTPSAFGQLMQADISSGAPQPTALRYVIFGGEALELQRLKSWFSRHGDAQPLLVNMYGITETCVHVTYRPIRTADLAADTGSVIGEPIPDLRVHVLDAFMEPVPYGVAGEMYVGGPGLARGYLERPALTAACFVSDPFEPGERLYRTGDLARRRASRELEYLGRIDHQVKIRGFRIELGEIESVLGQCAAVCQSAALVREDKPGDKRLVAYLVADRTQRATIRATVAAALPDYMVPSAYVFLDALPLTPNGKVDRRALPAPERVEAESDNAYVPPTTITEQALAAIWCELLGTERVGCDDGFFELGGHSLLATRLVSRVRTAFGIQLPVRRVFEHARLEDLARAIDASARLVDGAEPICIPRLPDDSGAPLSFTQQRMWVLQQLAPDGSAYNIPAALRLRGTLDVPSLQRAFEMLVEHHEILRTTYRLADTAIVQDVAPSAGLAWRYEDLSCLGDNAWDEALRRAEAEAQLPFVLAQGPVLRVLLIRTRDDEHLLLVCVHHIAADQWSLGILCRDIATAYNALKRGETPRLPEVATRYRDFAAWQRTWLDGERLAAQLTFWRERLAGSQPLQLPTDRPHPALYSFQGASVIEPLEPELIAALEQVGSLYGSTLFMTLFASLVVLLQKLSAQDDIVVAVPIANRNALALEGVVGPLVNTLVFRTQCESGLSFEALLGRVREAALAAYAYQDLPFEQLVEGLQLRHDPTRPVLAQVMFNQQNAPFARMDFDGLAWGPVVVERHAAQFELSFTIETSALGALVVEYSTDLFDSSTVRRFAAQYKTLLRAIAHGHSGCIGQLSLLAPEERRRVVEGLNATGVEHAPGRWLSRFERQVERAPEATAVSFAGQELSYGELNRRANRLAYRLRALGVGSGALAGVCLERSLELVVALLGVQKAGAAYVPLDPGFPSERLAYMLADSQAAVLVTGGSAVPDIALPADLRVLDLDREAGVLAEQPAQDPPAGAGLEEPAYVIYTSGSTGRPKGVAVSHGALVNFLESMRREPGLDASDVLAAVTTVSFDIAGLELYLPLMAGARIELVARAAATDGGALAGCMADCGATVLQATPATWRLLIEAGWSGSPHLRALCGGEALPRDLADALLPRVAELWNLYGPTETTIWSTLERVQPGVDAITIGRPIANTQVYILDRDGEPAPLGVPGEIWIGGAGVALGYHRRPELTAERFVPDRFRGIEGARLYRTGDLGRWRPDGRLEHLGRLDHQVKIRGYRIELEEIEAALNGHPAVRQAAVVAHEVRPGDTRLVAYLASFDRSRLGAVRATLAAALPDYMIPAAYVFLDALPLTPNGKLDRKALPAPEQLEAEADKPHVPPATPAEQTLAAIWCEVLGIARVGREDNFFALGGHSLLVARVAARLQGAFGVDVPLRALFELATLRELAAHTESLHVGGRHIEKIPVAERPARPPLSFAQQRIWFFHQLQPDSFAFNLSVVLRLVGRLDLNALEASLALVLGRHESLRTVFPLEADEPYQRVVAQQEHPIAIMDLGNLSAAERESALISGVTAERNRPFDLARGPLTRTRLICLGDEQHVFIVTFHHAISDAVSVAVFLREWAECYSASTAGQKTRLPTLPVQYVDFAIWQRAWLSGSRLEEQLDYWRRQLEGAPPYLDLPLDRPRPAVQTFSGAVCSRRLEPALRRRLDSLSRDENATLFMTMFSAFVQLLARHSGQDDLSVGVAVAGRRAAESENMIGLFINTLVLRARLMRDMSFNELLRIVRESALGAYSHQDLPFERLVEDLRPPRDLSRTPLFQVLFNMLDLGMPTSLQLPGLEVMPFSREPPVDLQAKFDLTLYVQDDRGGMALTAVYNTDLYSAARIEDLVDQYLRLLESACDAPARALCECSLVTDKASKALPDPNAPLSFVWNGSVQTRVAQHAAAAPARVAVKDADGALTYGELQALSNQLAQHLVAAGVNREDRVAIYTDRNSQLAWALLGVLKAGAAFVLLDSAYPPASIRTRLDLAKPKAWIDLTQRPVAEAIEAALVALPEVVRIGWGAGAAEGECPWRECSRSALELQVDPDDLAYLVFTSGTTGAPKAIAGTHAPLSHFFQWHQDTWGLGAADRVGVLSGLSHDPLLRDVLGALWVGATAVMPDSDVLGPSGDLLQWLAREAVTVIHITPAMAELLTLEQGSEPERALPALQHVFFGGDVLTSGTVSALRRLAPHATCVSFYGATETPQAMGWHRVQPSGTGNSSWRVPLGRGISDVQLLVLNESGRCCGIGELGEVHVRTPYLARGYFEDSALTAQRFVRAGPDGMPRDRMYRTGDLGRYCPDGSVEFAGRRDSQVKLRGFRVELGEIEAVLGAHPAVRQAVVLARDAGEGDLRLVAYIVYSPDEILTVSEIRRYLRREVPDYMVPSVFVALDAIPLTPNGKVDRSKMPDPFKNAIRSTAGDERPSPGWEQLVADIWQDILRIDRVGAQDNFFELGGHSLLSLRVAAAVERRTGWRMDPRILFFQNLRQIAANGADHARYSIGPSP